MVLMNSRRGGESRESGDRGVSEVLGAILVFGLVLAVLALVQLSAVPAANQQIEFEHSQRVAGDFQTLDENVEEVAISGTSKSTRVEAGVRYPPRLFLLNPPPVSGSLQTESGGSIVLGNVLAEESETGDYWDGTQQTRSTVALAYSADYNEYRAEPVVRYENGLLYRQFGDSSSDVVVDTGSIISGRRIDLRAMDGSLSTSTADEFTLNANPVSARGRPISVTGTDASTPITIALPTRLSEEKWVTEILATEVDSARLPSGGVTALGDCGDIQTGASPSTTDNRNIIDCDYQPGANGAQSTMTLTLQPGLTYDLRMAKVGLGDEFDQEGPAYLTIADGDGSTVSSEGSQRLTVEVRDQFNNPVSGTDVTFNVVTGNGNFVPADGGATSDAEGRASITYVPSSNGTKTIEATIPGGGEQRRVEFDFTVVTPGGTGGPDRLQDINTREERVYVESARFVDRSTVAATFRNTDTVQRCFFTGRLPFILGTNNPTQATLTDGGTESYGTLTVANLLTSIGGNDGICIAPGGTEEIFFEFNAEMEQSAAGNFDSFFVFTTQIADSDGDNVVSQTFFVSDGLNSDGQLLNPQADLVDVTGPTAVGPTGATTTSGVEFTLENTGTDDVTLSSIQVTSGAASRLGETNGGTGAFNKEVFVDASTDGAVDPSDGGNPNILGGTESFSPSPVISDGGTGTVTIYEFKTNSGNPVDMSGKSVTVTLTFSDGSTKEETLTIP